MKKKIIIVSFILVIASIFYMLFASAATFDNLWICGVIDIPEGYIDGNYSIPIECLEEKTIFMNTDNAAYFVVKLSAAVAGDKIAHEITGPLGEDISTEIDFVVEDIDPLYAYKTLNIDGENRDVGDYTVKLYIQDVEVYSGTFTIEEDVSETCEGQGFTCCDPNYVCISPKEGDCDSGKCCESEDDCVELSPSKLSRTEILDCGERDLPDCNKLVQLYEYNIHGTISPEQMAVIYYRGVDVDCYDKEDVIIVYYDDANGKWVEGNTPYVTESEGEGIYEATALIDYLGYVGLMRSKECVPTTCTAIGGYKLDPISGLVDVNNPISFELCGIVRGCIAADDGVCDRQCAGSDPDCGECTSDNRDCCLISYDGICDIDCEENVDPDCCNKDNPECCSGDSTQTGSAGCDENCGLSDASCSGCTTSEGDCCKADKDGVCDPDCPVTDGVYADADCCTATATAAPGDCCKAVCDSICDTDCMVGIDPDCYYTCEWCGDGRCLRGESEFNCPTDCKEEDDGGNGP
ncbi:MAG: hypothetical protein L6408_07065 [Nanoarchaeota archaeon]|nr:hypothetical protein [Nanoarchaeota archaeon]